MEEPHPENIEQLLQELKEDETEAERMADEASPPSSDKAAQHLERALALEDEDDYERALAECAEAIRLDSTLADTYNLRGVILEELGRESEAVLAYREALRLDPSFDAARENLQTLDAKLAAHGQSPLPQGLRCTARAPDLRQCPHEPVYKCLACGDPLCHEHVRLSQTARDDPSGHEYIGTYCDRHHRKLAAAPAGEEQAAGIASRPTPPNYWLWGLAYLPILIGAACLVFVVQGESVLLAAGIVWCVGGLLGILILDQKGSTALDDLEPVLDILGTRGCGEVGFYALALCGPFILLAALYAHRDTELLRGWTHQMVSRLPRRQRRPAPPRSHNRQ